MARKRISAAQARIMELEARVLALELRAAPYRNTLTVGRLRELLAAHPDRATVAFWMPGLHEAELEAIGCLPDVGNGQAVNLYLTDVASTGRPIRAGSS